MAALLALTSALSFQRSAFSAVRLSAEAGKALCKTVPVRVIGIALRAPKLPARQSLETLLENRAVVHRQQGFADEAMIYKAERAIVQRSADTAQDLVRLLLAPCSGPDVDYDHVLAAFLRAHRPVALAA
jgi:hypothetical protein